MHKPGEWIKFKYCQKSSKVSTIKPTFLSGQETWPEGSSFHGLNRGSSCSMVELEDIIVTMCWCCEGLRAIGRVVVPSTWIKLRRCFDSGEKSAATRAAEPVFAIAGLGKILIQDLKASLLCEYYWMTTIYTMIVESLFCSFLWWIR